MGTIRWICVTASNFCRNFGKTRFHTYATMGGKGCDSPFDAVEYYYECDAAYFGHVTNQKTPWILRATKEMTMFEYHHRCSLLGMVPRR